MNDHNDQHDERKDMCETRGALEDHRIGQFHGSRIAVRLDAMRPRDGRQRAYEGA